MLNLFGQTTVTTIETSTSSADTAFLGVGLMTIFLLSIVFYIIFSVILGFVFKKAGRPLWAAFIPIYNTWVLFEISGKPGWYALVGLVPFVGGIISLVLYIIAMLELAKKFGKSPMFAVFGLIIFSFIGFIILAFDSSSYEGAVAATGTSDEGYAPAAPLEPQATTDAPDSNDTNQQPPAAPTPPSTPPLVQ